MPISVEEEIRQLRSLFWSDRDPEGRVFAPLADAYRRQGDLAQAVDLLEEGLVRQVDFVPGHVVSAWVRRDRGENDAAAIAYRAALALDKENTEAARGLAELAALAAPAPMAAAAPAAPKVEPDDGPVTRTMADVYARQGLNDRALKVYRRLLERDPADASLRTRIAELEALVGPAHQKREPDVEKLARDWAAGPGDTGELSTPFAWTPALKSQPERTGPAARDYFRGLLAWEPLGEASAAEGVAAPERTVVPIASLAPENVVPVATLAPAPMADLVPVGAFVAAPVSPSPTLDVGSERVVAIASLAPDHGAPASLAPRGAPVAIASLAPDAVAVATRAPSSPSARASAVSIASLAPDSVPIASLAPDAVPIASLA